MIALPDELSQDLTPGARRIADAAIDLIASRGYEELSVRAVAATAGLTGGAVQHHFPTRAALLHAAFVRTAQRIAARVGDAPGIDDPQAFLAVLGEQLLPLDEERRKECSVWLAFSVAAITDPDVARTHRRAVDAFQGIAEAAMHARSLPPEAAIAFIAVVDGLTIRCLTGGLAPEAALRILRERTAYGRSGGRR
ncbi:TetR/AcrR family transcriptional regulator [uncultured Amnibacterium sp.]|uniref:TetR/AcrR family transcriptional regulator n=1 Tax=uncultured Amnibacterium sp. TaxID=1631851 RepID=UPI0035CA6578